MRHPEPAAPAAPWESSAPRVAGRRQARAPRSCDTATSGGGRQAVGGAEELRLIGSLGRQLVDDATAVDDDRPVAGSLDLIELRGQQQDRRAGCRQLADELVDLLLRADVDAARRVVEEERP